IVSQMPERSILLKLEHQLQEHTKSHLLVVRDENKTQQEWLWLKSETGKKHKLRSHSYKINQNPEPLLQKLENLTVTIEEENHLTHVDVVQKVKQGFDVEQVTKQFFQDFQKIHQQFSSKIQGLDEESERRWYTSVLLNRLMFIYFLQRRYFLDNQDSLYLQHKLEECQKQQTSFYEFLKELFFQGFAQPE
ncbi:MAG: SAM-dependent methyltransferase, partial [Geminocystis sp.]|nr:SAM-dependent methyltransferase [Geminocystis sp.]